MEKQLLTYYDMKYASTTKIFEAEEIKGLTPDQIKEGEAAYKLIVEKLEKGEEIDEGLLGAFVGGAAGLLIGPAIGRAICRALGIEENGTLGKLLTSRLVTTAIGVALGK
jgi:predicted nucleic acid-binding protein